MSARIVLVVVALAVAALAVGSVRLDSATADEGAHIVSGLIKLKLGWIGFFAEQPPLMNSISAVPLALAGYDPPKEWRSAREHWSAGHAFLYRSGYDARRILFLSRLPTIVLLLALCFLVYWFVARETGNRWWGLFAFALTGFCPNLLAHGRLATVDLAATFFMFAASVMFLDSLRGAGSQPARAGWRAGATSIAAGIFTACAVLSKTSALLLGPYFVVLLMGFVIRERSWRRFIKPVVVASVSALVVFEAVYLMEASRAYLDSVGSGRDLLMPFREYMKHIAAIRRWYVSGHENVQFLLGEYSYRGWPHYYFVAWLLKVPVGAQLLVIAAIVLSVRRRHAAVMACFAFVALFFAISMTSEIDLGIRYILPVFPFAYSAAAIAVAHAFDEVRNKRVFMGAAGALLLWHTASSTLSYPSYISYFNELIGRHQNADRFLIDSNLDWGQDLHRLRRWCDRHGVDFIRVDYFGGGDLAYEFGERAVAWPAPRPEPLPKGWFAVSRHLYRARTVEAPIDYDTYLGRSRAKYVATAGGSIYIYRVE